MAARNLWREDCTESTSGIVTTNAPPLAKPRPAPLTARGLLFFLIAAAYSGVQLAVTLTGYQVNLLMQAATYAVAVLGLVIVLGYTGQINLAQAAFFGLGASCVAPGTTGAGLGFWFSLALGVAVACGAGAILGLASLRVAGHYLAMVTISFQTILSLALNNWMSLTNGPMASGTLPGRICSRTAAEGPPTALLGTEESRAAYLGGRDRIS